MALRAGVAKLVGVALAGSLLIFAAPAAAKPCHPHGSGNSEVDQYMENVPGPCGNQGVGGNGSGNQGTSSGTGSGSSATGLPSGTITQLEGSGPAGQQAASFAEQTNPSGPAGASGESNGSASGSAANASNNADGSSTSGDGGGGSFLSALGHMVTGNQASAEDSGQGLGPLLPTLLAVVLLGGLGILALRRRRTG